MERSCARRSLRLRRCCCCCCHCASSSAYQFLPSRASACCREFCAHARGMKRRDKVSSLCLRTSTLLHQNGSSLAYAYVYQNGSSDCSREEREMSYRLVANVAERATNRSVDYLTKAVFYIEVAMYSLTYIPHRPR